MKPRTFASLLCVIWAGGLAWSQVPAGYDADLEGVATLRVPPGCVYLSRAEAEGRMRHPLIATQAPWIGVLVPDAAGDPAWVLRVERHRVGRLSVDPKGRIDRGALYRALAEEVEDDAALRRKSGFDDWRAAQARDVDEVLFASFDGRFMRWDLSVESAGAGAHLCGQVRLTREGYLRAVDVPQRALAPSLAEARMAFEHATIRPEFVYAAWRKGEPAASSKAQSALGMPVGSTPFGKGLQAVGWLFLGMGALAAPFLRARWARSLRRRG